MEQVTCRQYIENWFPGQAVRVYGKIVRTTIWMGTGCVTCGMAEDALAAFMVRNDDTLELAPFFCVIPVSSKGMLSDLDCYKYEDMDEISMTQYDWQ